MASQARWPHLPAGALIPGLFLGLVAGGPLAAQSRVLAGPKAAKRPSAPGCAPRAGVSAPGPSPGKGKKL